MKMHLLRRALCLLLVLSMLTPVAASAATPLYTYPSISIETKEGVTTNEMAYVDQFFNGAGGLNAKGRALEKWLETGVVDEHERLNSGYLMLEQEMEHQSSDRTFQFASHYIKNIRKFLETTGSLGVNIALSVVEENAYKKKFPNAGKESHIYYTYLYQIYFDYVDKLQHELGEVDESLKSIGDVVSDVTTLVPEMNDGVNSLKLQYARYKHSNTVAFVPDNYSGKINTFDVVDIKYSTSMDSKGVEQIGNVLFVTKTENGRMLEKTFEELIEATPSGRASVTYLDEAIKKLGKNKVSDILSAEFANAYESEKVDVTQLTMGSLWGVIDGVKATKAFNKLPDNVRGAFLKAETNLKKSVAKISIPTSVQNALDVTGKIADGVTAAAGLASYFEKNGSVTAQQMSYFNVLSTVTQEYLDMLVLWRTAVNNSDISNKVEIRDALYALVVDILTVHNQAAEKVKEAARKDAFHFTAADLVDSILNIVESVWGIAGFKGILERMAGATKATSIKNVGSVTGIGSVVLNAITNRFVEFDSSSQAVFDLKQSLNELLLGNKGLLNQYAGNRNHETACAIIYALKTIKSAKVVGEDLVGDYYLYDFYRKEDIEPNGKVHLILRNELGLRTGNAEIDASERFASVTAVYEDKVPSRFTPDGVNMGTITIRTEVISYYRNGGSSNLVYMNRRLENLPVGFSLLPTESAYFRNAQRTAVVESDGWESGEKIEAKQLYYHDVLENYKQKHLRYKDSRMQYYSSNGLELFLNEEEYHDYLAIEARVNELFDFYGDEGRDYSFIDYIRWDEDLAQVQYRLEWTNITRKWIESVEMYDESVDYSQYAFRCGSVR